MFFKPYPASDNSEETKKIFAEAEIKFSQQVFSMQPSDINLILAKNNEVKGLKKTALTKEEAWIGFKGKAKNPELYVAAIIKSVIIPGSENKTQTGEFFTRLTIQKSFVSGNLVVVKEIVHIIEKEKKIFFLGCPIEKEEAIKFLKNDFKDDYLKENPTIFHVEHALEGSESKPIAKWKMVRLSDKIASDKEEIKLIEDLKKQIANANGERIYVETLKQCGENNHSYTSS